MPVVHRASQRNASAFRQVSPDLLPDPKDAVGFGFASGFLSVSAMTENEGVFASEMSPALAKHEATARDDAASSSSESTAAAAAEPEDAAARELSAQDASDLQTNDSIELSRRAVPVRPSPAALLQKQAI